MKIGGIYLLKDEFFEIVSDPNLKTNKNGNRPHYYCFMDNDGMYWMIPLTSKVEKYKGLIQKRAENGKETDFIKILNLGNDKETVLLIQDMFPVKEKYIDRPYTINNKHLILKSENEQKDIDKRARKMLKLIRRKACVLPMQVDALAILDKIKNKESF